MRIYNIYQKSRGKKLEQESETPLRTKLEKYIEVSLNHKVTALKSFYTREARRRITSTSDKLYKRKSRLKSLIAKDPECRKIRSSINEIQASKDPKDVRKIKRLKRKLEANPLVVEAKEVDEKIRTKDCDFFSTVTSIHKIGDNEEKINDEIVKGRNIDVQQSSVDLEQRIWIESLTSELRDPENEFKLLVDGDHAEFNRFRANNEDVSWDICVASYLDVSDDFMIEHSMEPGKRIPVTRKSRDQRVADFVEVVTGEWNEDFDAWAKKTGSNTSNLRSLALAAKKYFELSPKDLKSHPLLLEMLK